VPFPLGIVLGIALIWFGVRAIYRQALPQSGNAKVGVTTALLCKIYAPATAGPVFGEDTHAEKPTDVTSLSGATLKLTGIPKAALDETVVVDLCVEAKPELPAARRQALLNHLLVQLSAVGLQIEPHEKIPATASSGACLGNAAWTVRASTPGRYTAVLMPESTDRQPNRPPTATANPQWDFALDQPAQLDIQFQPAWTDYVQKSWGTVSTILGTVLVFTQVMLNLRQRKKGAAA
jgi:hypothetical protein